MNDCHEVNARTYYNFKREMKYNSFFFVFHIGTFFAYFRYNFHLLPVIIFIETIYEDTSINFKTFINKIIIHFTYEEI